MQHEVAFHRDNASVAAQTALRQGCDGYDAQAVQDNEALLNIDCANIWDFDGMLYSQLQNYPAEVITLIDNEVNAIVAEVANDRQGSPMAVRSWPSYASHSAWLMRIWLSMHYNEVRSQQSASSQCSIGLRILTMPAAPVNEILPCHCHIHRAEVRLFTAH